MNSKKWGIGIIALVMLLLIAACGGNNSGTEPKGETPATPPAAETPAPETPANEGEDGDKWWEEVLAAADKEGLVIATSPGEREKEIIAAFQKEYPNIKIEHTGIRPSDIAPRVITEQGNNKFLWDVMIGSTSTMTGVLSPAGAYDTMESYIQKLPNYIDSDWHGGVEVYTSPSKDVLIHALKPYKTIYINKEHELADQFKSIDDLINPVFKGNIVIDTPKIPTYGSINLAGVLSLKDEEFIRKILVDQEPVYMDNIMTTTDWLGQKRYPIAIGADEGRILELRDAGHCTQCEPFDYGEIPMLAQGVATFKNMPNPNAAKVFVNWMLSQEGQRVYNETLGLASRRVDVDNYSTVEIDWPNWQDNQIIGTEEGNAALDVVMNLYKSLGL